MTEWKIGDGKCCIGRREGIDNEMKGRFCRGGEKIMVETWKREGYNGGRREGGHAAMSSNRILSGSNRVSRVETVFC